MREERGGRTEDKTEEKGDIGERRKEGGQRTKGGERRKEKEEKRKGGGLRTEQRRKEI